MSKAEIRSLVHSALGQSLQYQKKLVSHKSASELLPVIQRLVDFTIELEEWYAGKFHLRENERCGYFLRQAEEIESDADQISEQIWEYAPVSIVPIFRRIQERSIETQKVDSYPKQLRAQFNNFRVALLEQVAGARFLENNSDLGEEIERILVQYLGRRLGNSVRILRGGHIYDYENNRSGQIDIIITPANALGFCPADTGDGKYNVMIDQVIAAISVTSRLTPNGFRGRVEELQKIPVFKEKTQTYPGLKDQAWPLCYIIAAECEDLGTIQKAWEEIGAPEKPPAMVLLLDSGYIMQRTHHYREQGSNTLKRVDQLRSGEGIYAGLGLGWIEVQISARNWWMTNQRADWVSRLEKQLHELEALDPPLYDQKREPFFATNYPIHGVLKWGALGHWVHNRLSVMTIFVRDSSNVVDSTLLDTTKPFQNKCIVDYQFEPRWFKEREHAINGHYCALEEWINPKDRLNHCRRIAVFDSRSGEEVTSKLALPIFKCSELEQLNPVLRTES